MSFDFRDFLVTVDTLIIDSMHVIDKGGAQIALVVDGDQKLLGTLTDGDIRRGLLNGISLDSTVDAVMNASFCFVQSDVDEEVSRELMNSKQVRQMPVLDLTGRVVDLRLHDSFFGANAYANPVVIMAGGKGTRLRPYTENCPKPMLLIGGKPILEILLEQCIAVGFRTFYFSVNYLKEQIIDHFGDGSPWGVESIIWWKMNLWVQLDRFSFSLNR